MTLHKTQDKRLFEFGSQEAGLVKYVIEVIANWKLGNDNQFTPHFETGQNCKKAAHVHFRNFLSPTVLICCEFISHHRRGQDSLVLSASAV